MSSNVERVLIVHPFGIGDALFITPVIRALHENGAQKIDLLLGSRTKELFQNHPLVNQIFAFDRDRFRVHSASKKFSELFSLLRELRKNRYDTLFDFSLSRQYAFWATFFLWVPRRIGFDYKKRGIFLTHRIKLPRGFSDKHVVQYYGELLNYVSFSKSLGKLELFLSQDNVLEAERVLEKSNIQEPFIAVAPGGGESWGKDARLKRWPVPYFFELISKIEPYLSQRFKNVVIIGGKNEWELGESLRQLDPVRFSNLCGKTSLLGSAAILKKAQLLIANDGGIVHMASAVGTPVIALFGPVDPKVYGPYPSSPEKIAITNDGPECRPCYQNMRYNSECQHIDCLNTLKPNKVLEILARCSFFERLKKATSYLYSN